jgi:hypothetical protein
MAHVFYEGRYVVVEEDGSDVSGMTRRMKRSDDFALAVDNAKWYENRKPKLKELGALVARELFDYYFETDGSIGNSRSFAEDLVISLGNAQPPLVLPDSAFYLQGATEALDEIERTHS